MCSSNAPPLSKEGELILIFSLLRSGWSIDDYYYTLCFTHRRKVDEAVKTIINDRKYK
jgi:hypothetical protein